MAGFASRWWSRLTHPYTRMGLRAGRTVALGAGIFGAGYSSGVQASLEDPERVQREVLAAVLRQQGGSGDILAPDSRDARLVTRLGVQLIHAAEGHVAEQLEAAGEDEALRDGLETKLRALHNLPWKFVVIDSAAVNAFVTEMLPGYVFVHKGLLDAFDRNEDQLAFILGHELSHYLLDHGAHTRQLQGALSLLQLVVLASFDPTGLLGSLLLGAVELGVSKEVLDVGVALPASRTHETEADELGLKLCARSCHAPRLAAQAHSTLAAIERSAGRDAAAASIFATHPPTDARASALEQQVPAATQLYDACGCSQRSRALMRQLSTFRKGTLGMS